jgi:hypothetical protein
VIARTSPGPVLAWHGDPALKAEVLAGLYAHHAEDSIIQGTYFSPHPELASGFRGCAIGCVVADRVLAEAGIDKAAKRSRGAFAFIETRDLHADCERLLGIPSQVAQLVDCIFEGVHAAAAPDFAVRVTEAIQVGADLSLVTPRLMLDLLVDPELGVLCRTKPGSGSRAVVETVAELLARRLAGETVTYKEWDSASTAANAVADSFGAGSTAAWAAAGTARASVDTDGNDAATAVQFANRHRSTSLRAAAEHLAAAASFYGRLGERFIDLVSRAFSANEGATRG